MPKGVQIDVVQEKTLDDVKIPISGELKREDLIQEIEPVGDLYKANDKITELAFMEEPVTIHLHDSTNPNDSPYVFLCVNGEDVQPGNPWLRRGQTYTIKRKFVHTLLTSKTMSYSQPYKDLPSERSNYMRPQQAITYPFSTIKDSDKGAKWTQSLMAA